MALIVEHESFVAGCQAPQVRQHVDESEAVTSGQLTHLTLRLIVAVLGVDLERDREHRHHDREPVLVGERPEPGELLVDDGPRLLLPGGAPVVTRQARQLVKRLRIAPPIELVDRLVPGEPIRAALGPLPLEPRRTVVMFARRSITSVELARSLNAARVQSRGNGWGRPRTSSKAKAG